MLCFAFVPKKLKTQHKLVASHNAEISILFVVNTLFVKVDINAYFLCICTSYVLSITNSNRGVCIFPMLILPFSYRRWAITLINPFTLTSGAHYTVICSFCFFNSLYYLRFAQFKQLLRLISGWNPCFFTYFDIAIASLLLRNFLLFW